VGEQEGDANRGASSHEPAGHHRRASDPCPGRECLGARVSLGLRIRVIAAMHEQVGHLVVRRSEALQMSRRLEAAHHLLAHARGLVRVLGAVVQSLVLAMLDVEPPLFAAA